MTLSSYRNTAAAIAAAAVSETYPQVTLLGGGETYLGFCYDFQFPHPIHSELVAMIEQAMRQIVRERREINVLEMVPFSARELLKAKGNLGRAKELADYEEQFVEVIQIGSFHDVSPGEILKNSHQLSAFKIEKIEKGEDGVTRLSGYACPSKDELNEFLKLLKRYPEKRHETKGERSGLWKIVGDELMWLSKGLQWREKLLSFWKKTALIGFEEIAASPKIERKEQVFEILNSVNYELHPEAGLYGKEGTEIKIYTKDLISLLQSIEKSLNILGLEHNGQFCVEDAIRRKWPIVETEKKGRMTIVSIQIERMLALLVEKNELERLTFENQ